MKAKKLAPSTKPKVLVPREQIYQVVKSQCTDLEHYYSLRKELPFSDRFMKASCRILEDLQPLETEAKYILQIAPHFDYDAQTPGNGYRSLINVTDTALIQTMRLLRAINAQRAAILFRAGYFIKELEVYADILGFLLTTLQILSEYIQFWPRGRLVPDVGKGEEFVPMMKVIAAKDTRCFYGRAMGYHFCTSLSRIFQTVGMAFATYSISWEHNSGLLSSLISSSKFYISPELRSQRFVDIATNADVSFCIGFWNLAENQMMTAFPDWFTPKLQVTETFDIPAETPLFLQGKDGAAAAIEIKPPSSHTGLRPISARLLSNTVRRGMKDLLKGAKLPSKENPELSPGLVLHFHGGGFVANSPKSHESYLKAWVKELDCPLLSIDYSLAPTDPFPRALEETVYAYAWALTHASSLGWTGERICLTGDSAGGNLLTAATIKLIEMGVARLPDGLVPSYTPFGMHMTPGRLLCVMDPLLPYGIIAKCMEAYTAKCDRQEMEREYKEKETGAGIQVAQSDSALLNNHRDQPEEEIHQNRQNKLERPQTLFGENENQLSHLMHQISLSPSLADDHVLDFLANHELTKDSLFMSKPSTSSAASPSASAPSNLRLIGADDNEENMEKAHQTSDNNALPNSSSSSSSRMHALQPYKRPRRSASRTFSSKVGETFGWATGQFLDSITGWFDTKEEQHTTNSQQEALRLKANAADPSFRAASEFLITREHLEGPCTMYISPYLAPPSLLRQLPPVHIVCGQLDPIVDDSVEFGRKLRDSGHESITIDLLDGLPHGFLAFTLVSPECKEGARVCLDRIKQVLFPAENAVLSNEACVDAIRSKPMK